VYTYSAAQPFVLQRISEPYALSGRKCDRLDEKTPLLMRERLVIGIEANGVLDLTRLRILNLNVVNQQGVSINPTPIRPSFAGGAPSGAPVAAAVARGPFFLPWPDRLPGDVIPTVSVSAIYTPPMPGTPWKPNTFYPEGSVVVPLKLNGHYYTALRAGLSSQQPNWPVTEMAHVDEAGGAQLIWRDETPLPAPAECGSAKAWQQSTVYTSGTCVVAKRGRYWIAGNTATSGTGSEPFQPNSPIGSTVTEATGLRWNDKTPAPLGCTSARAWQSSTPYPAGSCVLSLAGDFWVSAGGSSGLSEPFPAVSALGTSVTESSGLKWQNNSPPGSLPSQCGSAAKPWQPNTPYAAGMCVTAQNSRQWVVIVGGVSADAEPSPTSNAGDAFMETTVLRWLDSGAAAPPSGAKQWLAGAPHQVGDVVVSPVSGHYYTAIRAGSSNPANPPNFPVTQFASISESGTPLQSTDGTVIWRLSGKFPPLRQASRPYAKGAAVAGKDSHLYVAVQSNPGETGADPNLILSGDPVRDGDVTWHDVGTDPKAIAWKPGTQYEQTAIVYSVMKAQYYVANSGGESALRSEEPDFPESTGYPKIEWLDSGSSAPGSVASGQPADQTMTLLNLTLPQSHVISTYNLAAGIVFNSIRTPTFSVNNQAPSGGTAQGTVQTGTSRTVDPVLLFTAYWLGHWFPMDAENSWRPRDLVPGLSFGLSLSSPASNYYFGGSSEFFLRNVQLTYGLSVAKVPEAASGSNGTSPSTRQHFSEGFFAGLTFNVSGFIQGLFGAKSSGQ
jgi:hypothetical protein